MTELAFLIWAASSHSHTGLQQQAPPPQLATSTIEGKQALEGISYLAFGWLFFTAASLAFTGSGSFAGMGEF